MNDIRSKKKIIIIILSIALVIIVILSIGSYSYLRNSTGKVTLEPQVKITNITYNYSSIGEFWGIPIWEEFNDEYGHEYSKKLQNNIIENMKVQAKNLGEDPLELDECIYATKYFDYSEYPRLPCYAEKANFEYYVNYTGSEVNYFELDEYDKTTLGQKAIVPCWIFVVNWGFIDEPLGHIKIFVISTVDHSIIYYISCT